MVGRATGPAEDSALSEAIAADVTDTATSARSSGDTADKLGSSKLHTLILESLEDDVAQEIVSISLSGKSSEADTMVVATGRSNRHVSAIAEKLMDRLKHQAGVVARAEGREQADWVLIDAGDVIVHIFRPEVREFYQLEKMWLPAPDAVAQT